MGQGTAVGHGDRGDPQQRGQLGHGQREDGADSSGSTALVQGKPKPRTGMGELHRTPNSKKAGKTAAMQ